MKNILIQNGKPIYVSNDLIDWWAVAKIIYKDSPNQLNDDDFDKWRGYALIRGEKIETLLKANNIQCWIWNEVARDWYLKENNSK